MNKARDNKQDQAGNLALCQHLMQKIPCTVILIDVECSSEFEGSAQVHLYKPSSSIDIFLITRLPDCDIVHFELSFNAV